MTREGSRPDRRPGGSTDDGRAVTASARVYGTLIRVYPKDLREEYGEEMVLGFRDLCRAELHSRGAKGLASLWGYTLSELVFTALKERSTMLARNAYLPVPPIAAARLGGVSALVGGACGVVAYYIGVSISIPISFVVLLLCALLSTLGLFGLYGTLAASSGRPGRLAAAGAVLGLASVGSWLALGVFGALTLAWDWALGPTHVAAAAALFCWFVGLLLLGVATLGTRLSGRLRALPLAVVALVPVSLVVPSITHVGELFVISLPFLGMALLGWTLIKSGGTDPLAVPGGATPVDGWTAPRMAEVVTRTASRVRRRHSGTSASEVAGEKELLEALRRHGELTAAGVALETSLSVGETERMLSELAAKGHLRVRSQSSGGLFYSLWEQNNAR